MHCFSRNMISNIYLRHLAIVFLLMLSACSQLPQQKPATAKTEAQLQQLNVWSIQGKLAIRSGNSAYNLLAHWQQRKEHFTLRLSGPLGWKSLTISNDENGITILRAGDISHYDSIEALETAVPELADWGGYLVALPDWLKAVPHSAYALDSLSRDNGKISFFEQQGWHIGYLRYTQVDGFQLPTKISMVRGQTQAKIIINQWLMSTI